MAQDVKQLKIDLKALHTEKAGLEKEVLQSQKAHTKLAEKNQKAIAKLDGKIAKLEDKMPAKPAAKE